MQDMTIAFADLEHVTGGQTARSTRRPVSTTIDSGMIGGTFPPSRPGPMIDSGMIGGTLPRQPRSGPIDYGPFTPRNMPR